ncbi:alpha/beta hydrolase family protein [Brevundimonas bacteroides]|uniref:alpha/beta hydrolase family protein n=1 Tax=Brevundimonas bacteroides TaxID=74311 RepID=UPI000691006F|nr:alpha/beta hydrolase [Brevundimonas bacteroides]
MTVNLRLIGLFAASLALASAVPVAAQDTATLTAPAPSAVLGDLTLRAPDGRDIPVFVFPAAEERAVVVFSHGLGGDPRAYREIIGRWAQAGFTVVAPLHVDSQRHPGGGRAGGAVAFMTRIADLAVVRDHVRAEHAGKPMAAAGHSFGSLLSLMAGGAVTAVGPQSDPDVRVVVALSSPGAIQGLVQPETYGGLTVPMLMVTGDADVVETYAPDWRDHRIPFDTAPPGDRMLVIFEGGGHGLVVEGTQAQRAFLAEVSLDFLRAHTLGDTTAQARLAALPAPAGVQIERR